MRTHFDKLTTHPYFRGNLNYSFSFFLLVLFIKVRDPISLTSLLVHAIYVVLLVILPYNVPNTLGVFLGDIHLTPINMCSQDVVNVVILSMFNLSILCTDGIALKRKIFLKSLLVLCMSHSINFSRISN